MGFIYLQSNTYIFRANLIVPFLLWLGTRAFLAGIETNIFRSRNLKVEPQKPTLLFHNYYIHSNLMRYKKDHYSRTSMCELYYYLQNRFSMQTPFLNNLVK